MIKRIYLIIFYIHILCSTVFSQCNIEVKSIVEDNFICQNSNIKEIQSLWDSLCLDSSSEYHFIYTKLPHEKYYSLVMTKNKLKLESERGEIALNVKQIKKLRKLLVLNNLNKSLVQKCKEEIKFGGQVLEFAVLKSSGKLTMSYQGTDMSNEPLELSENKELLSLKGLLVYLNELRSTN